MIDTVDTALDTDVGAPPTDVEADCWSWSVEVDTADDRPSFLGLTTYDPGTLTLLGFDGDFSPRRR